MISAPSGICAHYQKLCIEIARTIKSSRKDLRFNVSTVSTGLKSDRISMRTGSVKNIGYLMVEASNVAWESDWTYLDYEKDSRDARRRETSI